ncbi:hypothetical protein Btru_064825 [Bulinus truncatus]|nr:hypothetical protein Btru_064825 [Bulinus truncatus]
MGTIPDCTRYTDDFNSCQLYGFTVTCSAASAMVHFETSRETVSNHHTSLDQNKNSLSNFVTENLSDYAPPCGYS